MATTLYLREQATSGIGTYRDAITTAGSSATTGVVDTVASGTEIQWTKTAGGAVLEWISGRSPAGGWTLAGTVSFSVWAAEDSTSANCGARARLFKRTAAGSESEIGGGPWDDGVEFTKDTPTEMTWTGSPSSTVFSEDDRLVIRIYITNVGTMGGGRICTLTYDEAEAATGDSQITLTETVAFKAEVIERTPAETAEVIEFRKAVVSPLATHPAEALTVSEGVTRRAVTGKALTEAISVAENVTRNMPSGPLARSVAEAVGVAESQSFRLDPLVRSVSETVRVVENRTASPSTVRLKANVGVPEEWLTTLATGHSNGHALVYGGGYLWSCTLTINPTWIDKIDPATGTSVNSAQAASDGFHILTADLIYSAVKGKLYFICVSFSRTLRLVEVDPTTLGLTDVVSESSRHAVSLCADDTYAYVADVWTGSTTTAAFIRRYLLSDWSAQGSIDFSPLTSIRAVRISGSKLYAIGGTTGTAIWVARVDLGTFTVDDSQTVATGFNSACDDIAFSGGYLWLGQGSIGSYSGYLAKIEQADLTNVQLVNTGSPYSILDVHVAGNYLWVSQDSTAPAKLVRLDLATNDCRVARLPSVPSNDQMFLERVADDGTRLMMGFAVVPTQVKASLFSQLERESWPDLVEDVAITDAVTAETTGTAQPTATPSESIAVSDTATPRLGLGSRPAETVAATDFFVSGVVDPAAVHAAEDLTATDTATVALQLGQRPAEAVSTADAATVAVQLGLRLTEVLAALDSLTAAVSPLVVQTSDALSATDSAEVQETTIGSLERSIAEAITATDSAHAAIPVISTAVSEAITATDSATKSTAQAEVGSQAILAVVELDGTNAEAWVGSQAILIVLELFPDASVSDAIALVDAVTAAITAGPISRSGTDTIAVSEFLKGVVSPLAVHAAEAVTAADVVTAGGNRTASVADTVAVSEFLKAVRSPLAVHAAEAVTATDAATPNLPLGRAVSVAITVTEFAKAVRSLGKVLSEAATVSDSADPQIVSVGALARSVNEQIQATDFVKIARSLTAKREELIAVSDAASASVSPLLALLSEAIAVAEFVQQASELRLDLAETAAVLDAVLANVATAPSFEAAPYETVGVSDSVAALVAFDYESRGRQRIFETPVEASASGSRIFETPGEATASGSRIFGTTSSGTPRIFEE